MNDRNEAPALYQEGYAETLGECEGLLGLCCNLDDEFIRDLGQKLNGSLTVYARGVGRRILKILSVQGDVLRALDIENDSVLLIPVCAIYLFFDAHVEPVLADGKALIRLDGGGSCRGCFGMVPELLYYLDKTVNVRLPEGEMRLTITDIAGLTLRGVSGKANVSLRIDCIDALELPNTQ